MHCADPDPAHDARGMARELEELLRPRRMPRSFEDFLGQTLCVAVRPDPFGTGRSVLSQSAAVLRRHETCLALEIRYEIAYWITSLLQLPQGQAAAMAARMLQTLLDSARGPCSYRLGPAALDSACNVVLIQESLLERCGKKMVLHLLWESEVRPSMDGERSSARDRELRQRRNVLKARHDARQAGP